MSDTDHAVSDAAPWERPAEPDHPMLLDGGFAPGNPAFMLRCLCEEFLMCGTPPERLWAMARDPRYQALAALRAALGDAMVEHVITETVRRIGRHRIQAREAPVLPPCLDSATGGTPFGVPPRTKSSPDHARTARDPAGNAPDGR